MIYLMLIEDDPEDQQLFTWAVEDSLLSIDLRICNSGEQAIELLETADILPDLIFMDWNMPKLSGIECLNVLKSNKRFDHIPIYIHTTSSNLEDERLARSLGATGYIIKNSNKLLVEMLHIILSSLGTENSNFIS